MQLGLFLSGKGITPNVSSLGLPNTVDQKTPQPAQYVSRVWCIHFRDPLTIQSLIPAALLC